MLVDLVGVIVSGVGSCMVVGWWYWFPVFVKDEGVRYVVGVGVVGVGGEDYIVCVLLSIVGVWSPSGYDVGSAAFGIVVAAWEGFVGAGVVVQHVW